MSIKKITCAALSVFSISANAYNVYNQTDRDVFIKDPTKFERSIAKNSHTTCNPKDAHCNGPINFTVSDSLNGKKLCTWSGHIQGKGNYFVIRKNPMPIHEECLIEFRHD